MRLPTLILTSFGLLFATAASAEMNPDACAKLKGQEFDGVKVAKTEWLKFEKGDVKEVCVTTGFREPFLDIEVVLPQKWSGRYMQNGGAGLDGYILSGVLRDKEGKATGLKGAIANHGMVWGASNGGNRRDVKEQAAPAVWLGDGPEAAASLLDFNYRALQETTDFAHNLIDAAYGRKADYRYFSGASNGGRHAYIVAQRWPDRFDGIVAGKETINIGGTAVAWVKFGQIAGTDAGLSNEQYTASFQAALKQCDGDDGAVDGILTDPYACKFPTESLNCKTSKEEHCLSDAQVGTLNLMMTDIKDSYGNVISSAYPWTDFSQFAAYFPAYGSITALMATGDKSWLQPGQLAKLDMDRDPYMIVSGMRRSGASHDIIGVAQFVAKGGKLLSWHPGSDNLHPEKDHKRNHTTMKAIAKSLAEGTKVNVDEGTRYFVLPGAMHGQGDYPAVDWITAIMNWVEKGDAPKDLVFNRKDGKAIKVLER